PSILPSMVRSAAISDSLATGSAGAVGAVARGGPTWVGLKSATAVASRGGVAGGASGAKAGVSLRALALLWGKIARSRAPRAGQGPSGWRRRTADGGLGA